MKWPLRSSSGLGPRKRFLWTCVRRLMPAGLRFFYEGHPDFPGQLWLEERKLLYRTVRARRPRVCFEIGTWRGGGSTYFTCHALADNGAGVLHTIETDPAIQAEAAENYRLKTPRLTPFIRLHLGDYREVYGPLLREDPRVDMVFLDGPEDAEVNEQQFLFFQPRMKAGSILFQHDWFTEKARLVRAHLEKSPDWQLEAVLSPPYSLGLALAIHR